MNFGVTAALVSFALAFGSSQRQLHFGCFSDFWQVYLICTCGVHLEYMDVNICGKSYLNICILQQFFPPKVRVAAFVCWWSSSNGCPVVGGCGPSRHVWPSESQQSNRPKFWKFLSQSFQSQSFGLKFTFWTKVRLLTKWTQKHTLVHKNSPLWFTFLFVLLDTGRMRKARQQSGSWDFRPEPPRCCDFPLVTA